MLLLKIAALDAAEALRHGDLTPLGQLMMQSSLNA